MYDSFIQVTIIVMNNIFCPKCGRIPRLSYVTGEAFTTHTCYDLCGYQFWTLKQCPNCEEPEKTIFLNKPNFGQKITCQNCNSRMYYFRCPNSDCCELFYKTEQGYQMGGTLKCVSCEMQYKLVTCICGGEIKFDKNKILYQGYDIFECKCCTKKFTFTICTRCKNPEFHIDKLDIGDRIRCSSCKSWRKYVPCPKCGKTLKGEKFSYCQPNQCENCNIVFEYSKCAYGCSGVNYNLLKQDIGGSRNCYQCKKQYLVINCHKCQQTLYLQSVQPGIGMIEFCPHCKNKIQYYLCPFCKLFNNEDSKCTRTAMCKKPTAVVDNTIVKQEKKERKESKAEESYNQEQCKICYSEKSIMINQVCGHVLMCGGCYKTMETRARNTNFACPVCKQIGPYYRYRKPIYS